MHSDQFLTHFFPHPLETAGSAGKQATARPSRANNFLFLVFLPILLVWPELKAGSRTRTRGIGKTQSPRENEIAVNKGGPANNVLLKNELKILSLIPVEVHIKLFYLPGQTGHFPKQHA